MNKIAQFFKISEQEWEKTGNGKSYDSITLPIRKTKGSAGYDFIINTDTFIQPGGEILVPTGVRCKIDEGWVLCLFPRSGLGFKYGLHLTNTVGIIDSDYFNAKNEGHIMAKLHNPSDKYIELKAGDGYMQGVFLPFGITMDDDTNTIRVGGFGSTDASR